MKVVITGGAGFIGTNLAADLAKEGHDVIIFDNLSRKGTDENAKWLTEKFSNVTLKKGDLRTDQKIMDEIVADAEAIYHLGGQVAVTTSVANPREDFEINALGTLNLLEAVRLHAEKNPVLVYASTNKVYGGMEEVDVIERDGHYIYADIPHGIAENQLIDFHSPYGCSKGAADQYVRDYARIYGLRTVVFRQSCIYGPRQFGIEDQGWVAWFTIAALAKKPIMVYGDGKQVRDVLYVDDLVRAYKMATEKIDITAGRIYNVGGGIDNAMSLIELLSFLGEYYDRPIEHSFGDWRPGDQPVYISDIGKAKNEFDWAPTISAREGVKKLTAWVKDNKELFEKVGLI
jgi:CDP-paratose 2-epimerase